MGNPKGSPQNFKKRVYKPYEEREWEDLTARERAFVLNYVKTGNITQSICDAGYKPTHANQAGKSLLGKPHINKQIKRLMEEKNDKLIADGDEVLRYLTATMRGELKDQFGLETSISERTRAAVELAKRTVDIDNKLAGIEENKVHITIDWGD